MTLQPIHGCFIKQVGVVGEITGLWMKRQEGVVVAGGQFLAEVLRQYGQVLRIGEGENGRFRTNLFDQSSKRGISINRNGRWFAIQQAAHLRFATVTMQQQQKQGQPVGGWQLQGSIHRVRCGRYGRYTLLTHKTFETQNLPKLCLQSSGAFL